MSTENGFAMVNGLNMYYEIHGQGQPLVLIHGGGSSIDTTFARVLPFLSPNYRILAMDLQGHGRTKARPSFVSNTIPVDADDVYALMQHTGFTKASVLGFSKGGASALYLATRHPEVIDRLIIAGIFCRKDGAIPGFWDGFSNATIENMPQKLRDAQLALNSDPEALQTMFELDCRSMVAFEDWSDADLERIQPQTLILTSFQDVVTPEHALRMSRVIPNAELVLLRGAHGAFLGDSAFSAADSRMPQVTAEIVHNFLSGH